MSQRGVRRDQEVLERTTELALLDEALRAGRERRGGLLVVEGTLGAGKTAILQEAHARAHEMGMQVLRARSSELEREFPLGVARQLFDTALAAMDAGERERTIGSAAGTVARLFEARAAATTGAVPADAEYTTLHGLYWLLVDLSARRPALVTVDDIEFADAMSLRWLAYVVKRVDGIAATVVVTLRPRVRGADDRALEEIRTESLPRAIRLSPLSESATGQLIATKLGAERVDEAFCHQCHAVTRGNPLLLTELLSELAAAGVSPTRDNAQRVTTFRPPNVTRHAMRQFARLSDPARRLADALVVLGRSGPLEAAAALADLSLDASLTAADELERCEIARLDGRDLVFDHPIVRVAAHAALEPAVAARLHARAARQLHRAGADASQVAAHLMASPPLNDEWAVEGLREAAREAMRLGAVEAAVRYLRRALADVSDTERRVEVLAELGLAEMNVPATAPDALERLREARELAASAERRGQLAFLLARALAMAADSVGAAEVLEAAIDELCDEHAELAVLLEAELISVTIPNLATNASARGRLEAAVAKVPPGSAAAPLLEALSAEARVAAAPAAEQPSQAELMRLVGVGKTRFDEGDTRVLWIVGETLTWREQLAAAADAADHMLATARARGSPFLTTIGATLRSNLDFRLGAVAAAEVNARTAFEVAAGGDRGHAGLPYPLAYLIDALIERNEVAQADRLLTAHGGAGELPELWPFTLLLDSRARLRLAQGRVDEAVADALECGRRLDEWDVRNPAVVGWRVTAVEALAASGAADAAIEHARVQIEAADELGLRVARGVGLRALGMATPGDKGVELLSAAVSALAGTDAALEHARSLTDLGAALRRRGRPTAAREPLRRALDIAVRSGANALADRAHTELVSAGARPRRRVLKGAEALTASERRVAEMARGGMTNRAIAEALFVTEKTVEAHLSRAYSKLGVRSRARLNGVLADVGAAGGDLRRTPADVRV